MSIDLFNINRSTDRSDLPVTRVADGGAIVAAAIEVRRSELAWNAADTAVSTVCGHAKYCKHTSDADAALDAYTAARKQLDALVDSRLGGARS
jgi:hypothetical protein